MLVRDHDILKIYLNGQATPEIEANVPARFPAAFDQFFLGGRSDRVANWEGRLDEIAIFDRVLSAEEVAQLFAD